MILRCVLWGLLLTLGAGCDTGARGADPPPPPPDGQRGRVVFLGTSLTAGLGLDPDQAYPALLQQKIGGTLVEGAKVAREIALACKHGHECEQERIAGEFSDDLAA